MDLNLNLKKSNFASVVLQDLSQQKYKPQMPKKNTNIDKNIKRVFFVTKFVKKKKNIS